MTLRYTWGPCPVCAYERHHEVADRDDILAEVERLWAFHMRRLRPGTPPPMLTDRIAFSQHPPVRIARCQHCTHLFRNPHERDDVLTETYAGEAPSREALQGLHDAQLDTARDQARRLTDFAAGSGTGYEIGSYAGAFLTAAREFGWKITGVDVNAACTAFVSDAGHAAIRGSVHDIPADAAADAICLWNCLDQMPDPGDIIRAAFTRVRSGGVVVARVPNGSFYHGVRSRRPRTLADALLAHNNLLGFPYRHGFTPRSLTTLLKDAGFVVRRVVGDTLVPTADRWTRGWARHEERILKAALRPLPPHMAPWLEAWAIRS